MTKSAADAVYSAKQKKRKSTLGVIEKIIVLVSRVTCPQFVVDYSSIDLTGFVVGLSDEPTGPQQPAELLVPV